MLSLEELADKIRPDRTILLLGAGATASSGGPTGAGLAHFLAEQLSPSPDGDDLMEISGIFENRRGREELIKNVRSRLEHLEPSGAILAIPTFKWRAIYTTNYDQILEKAYKAARTDFSVVRSNYDFSRPDPTTKITPIYKIHGCLSQDIVDGHNGRMLLTERDYDTLTEYRQSLFRALAFDMTTADTLIIGLSLRDAHLRDLAKEAAQLHSNSGTNGQVYMLVYESDPDRGLLLEQKGIQVAFGDLAAFFYALTTASPASDTVFSTSSTEPGQLPPDLAVITTDISHASKHPADAVRLYNGSSATYGDIANGLTIPRAIEQRLMESQAGYKGLALVLTGVTGVGKTSLGRRLMYEQLKAGAYCWEHLTSFPLDPDAWIAMEETLRAAKKYGYLFIDNCVEQLSSINKLMDHLGSLNASHLRIIVTANSSQWNTRTKSPYFYGRGTIENLSRLTEADLEQLINLVEREPRIQALVEADFAILSRDQRIRRLRDRCSAEMYGCLKNIFGSERLDDILLREYAELNPAEQDIYRHVAVLQAMGGKVHRQLIIRLLGIDAGRLQAMLTLLDGIVSEYDISPHNGLYGWTARHDVIAEVIATYKFAMPEDLHGLLSRLVEGINPAVWLELETARAICTTNWGIRRLSSSEQQIDLYKRLISIVPAERIPRRRLIRKYLDLGMLDDATHAIQSASEAIGADSIIERYRVYLAMNRAEKTAGILDQDRSAMLYSARSLALNCISTSPNERHNYHALAEVSVALARRTNDLSPLDDAIDRMKDAEQTILDPEMAQDRRHFEQIRRTFHSASVSFPPVK